MAPIRARNAATGSCWCARRPVAARASPRGKSPSTSAAPLIAAIIRNHSRRVPLVTARLTLYLPSRVAMQYVPRAVEGKADAGDSPRLLVTPQRQRSHHNHGRPPLQVALHLPPPG